MVEFVVFGYLAKDAMLKTCLLKYEELDEMTKMEFEMMFLAGSYLEPNQIKSPMLLKTCEKWKSIAMEQGQLQTQKLSPNTLFAQMKLMAQQMKYCILLSDQINLQTNLESMRVFWGDTTNEQVEKTIDCKSDDIKTVLKEAFNIHHAQLSDKTYGFITASAELLNTNHTIQLIDKQIKFLFVK